MMTTRMRETRRTTGTERSNGPTKMKLREYRMVMFPMRAQHTLNS